MLAGTGAHRVPGREQIRPCSASSFATDRRRTVAFIPLAGRMRRSRYRRRAAAGLGPVSIVTVASRLVGSATVRLLSEHDRKDRARRPAGDRGDAVPQDAARRDVEAVRPHRLFAAGLALNPPRPRPEW